MLKRLNVRTKLLVVVAPLIALVLAASWAAVTPRLDKADQSAQDRDLVELLLVQSRLHSGLEAESLLTVAGAAASAEAMSAMDEVRASNDQLVAGFQQAAADTFGISADLDEALQAELDRLGELVDNRESVDSGSAAPTMMVARFDVLVDGFGDIARYGARAINAPDVRALVDLTGLIEDANLNLGTIGRRGTATIAGVTASIDADRILLQDLQAQRARLGVDFTEAAPQAFDAAYTEAQSSSTSEIEALVNIIFIGDQTAISEIGVDRWTTAVTNVLEAQTAIAETAYAEAASLSIAAEDEASKEVRNFAIIGAAGLLLAVAGTVLVARSITRPLRRLRDAADVLASEQLPALVERLRNPDQAEVGTAETLTLATDSRDELGQLAGSINAIQEVAVEVANNQAELLRKGISDMFVNLARRNQTLLDRQIEFIDQLEAGEEDPELLENLFRLDHLATRMRRNAESLLVLAGAEPPRRRGGAVPVMDVIRVAIGEVEDFARITLLAIDDVEVNGPAAPDLAHLLSELMENATQFSPPSTAVEVIGSHETDGSYVITITDAGIGMTQDQLAAANTLLADPPVVGLTLARSLGFIVVGRLADRFGISVSLVSGRDTGVTACVRLPGALLGHGSSIVDQSLAGAPLPAALSSTSGADLLPPPATVPPEWLEDTPPAPTRRAPEPAPVPSERWTDRVPSADPDPFEADLGWLLNDGGREVRPVGSAPAPDLPPAPWETPPVARRAPEPVAEPVPRAAAPEPPPWASLPEPVLRATQPEPTPVASPQPEPAPWAALPEPEPAPWAPEPEPAAWMAEPEPAAWMAEPEPAAWMAEPEPAPWASQSEPAAWMAEPEPAPWAAQAEPRHEHPVTPLWEPEPAPAVWSEPPAVAAAPPVGWVEPPAPSRDWSTPTPQPGPVLSPDAPAPLAARVPLAAERPARLADLASLGPALSAAPAPAPAAPAPPVSAPAPPSSPFTSPWGDPTVNPTTAAASAASAVTRSGLAKRVPGRTLEGDDADRPVVAASKRSPDDVRRMLSRYRTGLNHGRDGDSGPRA